jgi:hypothetical protein
MSKKKDIANLISGICSGTPTATTNTDITEEAVTRLQITDEMQEALNERRRAKVGRPVGTGKKEKNENEGRATFVVDNNLIRKIKYISLCEGKLLKDILSEMMGEYIDKWENENRKIDLP